ncbi:hypothetical protein D9M69_714230 [compost metagenome]
MGIYKIYPAFQQVGPQGKVINEAAPVFSRVDKELAPVGVHRQQLIHQAFFLYN